MLRLLSEIDSVFRNLEARILWIKQPHLSPLGQNKYSESSTFSQGRLSAVNEHNYKGCKARSPRAQQIQEEFIVRYPAELLEYFFLSTTEPIPQCQPIVFPRWATESLSLPALNKTRLQGAVIRHFIKCQGPYVFPVFKKRWIHVTEEYRARGWHFFTPGFMIPGVGIPR